jgi:phenylpropionate dioxygenase-like ring-hydroxylating dioxygenase large terminal subunit
MGAYFRFFERRTERQFAADATRGVIAPTIAAIGIPRSDDVVTDRRQLVPPLGLREYWYPVLPAWRVPKKRPLYWRMLGEELSLFRDRDGSIAAVGDVCPHRGGSMSRGSCFFPGTISCPYHGATFDASGECKAFLPEGPDSKMVGNLHIKTYPTRTLRGYVFVWMGAGEPEPIEHDVPPEFFEVGTPATILLTTYTYWQCNWILAIENQNDSHNGFYAHRNSLMQLTKRRGRARSPLGPRSKLLLDRALIPLMMNQTYYKDETGAEPYQLHYPEVGAFPVGQWRRWVWALFAPWYRLLNSAARASYASSEEWGESPGSSLWHLPSMVRVNFGQFAYTRAAVPVTENISRIVYFHHRPRAKTAIGRFFQVVWYYAYFNWWLHYNFSSQDGAIASPCRYWTEENLAPTDSHLVLLRKLITERSRDVLKRGNKPGTAVQTPGAEEKFYQEQRRLGIDVENSLEEAAAVIDTGVDKGSVVFGIPTR